MRLMAGAQVRSVKRPGWGTAWQPPQAEFTSSGIATCSLVGIVALLTDVGVGAGGGVDGPSADRLHPATSAVETRAKARDR